MNHHNIVKTYDSLYEYVKEFDISHYRYNYNRETLDSFVSSVNLFNHEDAYIDDIDGRDTFIKGSTYVDIYWNGENHALIDGNCLKDKLYCIYDRVGGEWICRGTIYKDEESAFEALEGVKPDER